MTIKQMVFGDASAPFNPGLTPMRRLAGPVSIVIDQSFADEFPESVKVLRKKAQDLQDVIGFGVTVGTVAIPGTAVFPLRIDPAGTSGSVSFDIVGSVIVGGRLFFSNPQLWDEIVGHELGHIFGLFHQNQTDGLMNNGHFPWYSPAEVEDMKMMLQFAPGITWPHNDRSAASPASLGRHTVVIKCSIR